MPFHLAAYGASVANTGNVDVAAISDQVLAISNNHFLPQEDWNLVYAMALSTTMQRARIVSPTNRQITLPFIRPTNLGANPLTNPGMSIYANNPFRIRGLEELAVEVSQGGAGNEQATVLVALQKNREPIPQGDEFTMRGTSSTAAVANQWTDITIAWADTLPAGEYVCTGLEYIGVVGLAARAIFENQVERPGVPAIVLETNRMLDDLYQPILGVYGRFKPTRMPIIQVLNSTTTATHAIYMSFIRIW